jgi:hypothetical protein
MKIPKTESKLSNKDNSLKSASEMSSAELSTWFAFCNGLKFINLGETSYKEEIQERDIPYSAILNYTQTVSGDIEQYLHSKGAIPMKYSLDSSVAEAHDIEEVTFIVE